jgi:site-specific recombinase XerD
VRERLPLILELTETQFNGTYECSSVSGDQGLKRFLDMTIQEAILKFLKYKSVSNTDDDYLRHYSRELNKFAEFCKGENITLFSDLEFEDVIEWLGTFESKGQMARAGTYLRMLFKYFEDTERFEFPWRMIDSNKPKSQHYEAMTYEEFIYIDKCFIDLIKCEPSPHYYKYRAMHHVLWCTGARKSEIVGIRLSDINWVNHEYTFEAGKGNGTRPGKFFTGLDPINEYLTVYHPRERLFDCSFRSVSHMFNFVKSEFGIIRNLSPHCYRAGLITWLTVEKEIPIKVVQEYVGHDDINTTARYARVSERTVMNKIGEAFTPVKKTEAVLKFGKKRLEISTKFIG